MSKAKRAQLARKNPLPRLAAWSIGISISESPAPDLVARGLGKIHLDHAFVELTRHLLAQGATVTYGGDTRVKGFTQTLFDIVRTYDRQDKPTLERIRNYLAWPIHQAIPVAGHAAVADIATLIRVGLPIDLEKNPITRSVNPGKPLPSDPAENRYIWARCLTAMRQKMNSEIQARILLGGRYGGIINGKPDCFLGKYPGLVEEAHLAIKTRKPIFLLGGFGGCTKVLCDALLGQSPAQLTLAFHAEADPIYRDMAERIPFHPDAPIDYRIILTDFQRAGIAGLKNGLDEQENRCLFDTDDIDEMIALVLKGLTGLNVT